MKKELTNRIGYVTKLFKYVKRRYIMIGIENNMDRE